ncbi:MAG: HEAT repeat domain-containing protein [Planctomycetaceae bacterium]|jgi:HEAT repeat protein|nr:HEAT repeat domain-containing protein [Planctomycetaceae bacterium]
MKQIFSLAIVSIVLVSSAFAQDPGWHKVPDDALNKSGAEIIRKLLTSTNEAEMLEIIKPATDDDLRLRIKIFAYKRVAMYGTKAAVPILVEKIELPKEGFYARYALESIPDKEVDVALCEIAGKVKKPEVLAGIFTTLGVRANPQSAEIAKSFLNHEIADVRQAAAYAYASTAGDTAIEFFKRKSIDPLIADSAFLCAEFLTHKGEKSKAIEIYDALSVADIKQHQKEAALTQSVLSRGEAGVAKLVELLSSEAAANFEVGLKVGRELPAGKAVTKAMIDLLDKKTNPTRKAKLVRSIGDRKDNESKAISLPVISGLAKSGDEAVRVAAIESFCNIGDSSVLPILIDAAKQNESARIANVARLTLQNLAGSDIDAAIGKLLDSNDKDSRIIAIGLVKERRIISAYPLLKKSLSDSDADVSKATIDAIGQTAGLDDLPTILDLFIKSQAQAETDKILSVLKSACTRLPQDAASAEVLKIFEKSAVPVKVNLLELFKEIGGAKAVGIVERSAWEDADEVQNKATEVLGRWVSQKDVDLVARACLKLAKESKYKSRGLRGYIRLARQFAMPEDRKLQICQETYDLAVRDEDRILIFDVYDRNPSPKVFDVAANYLDVGSEKLRDRAAQTVVTIGEKLQVRSPKVADAMKKVIDQSKNENLKERAKRVFDKQ